MPITRSRSGRSPGHEARALEANCTPTVKSTTTTSATTIGPMQMATEKVGSARREKETTTSRARSTRSVASRKRLLAELEAKKRVAELAWKAAEEERKFQQANLELLQAEAEEEELESCDELEENDASVRVERWLEKSAPELGSSKKEPQTQVCEVTTLAEALTQALRATTKEAPRFLQEVPPFSGKSEEWLTFKAAYMETQGFFSKTENAARLRRSLRGPAWDAVNSLFLTEIEPKNIIEALERRFGRAEALVLDQMEKLRALPRLHDSPRDVCVFASKFANIVATIEALNRSQYLFCPQATQTAIEKLPPILRDKWYDFAASRKDTESDLKKLASFLNEEADKRGPYAPPERAPETSHAIEKRRPERTFYTEKKEQCPTCKSDHQLIDCKKFLDLTVDERWDVARKTHSCFKCLRGAHRRLNCRSKKCGVNGCTMSHHNLLHNERRNQERKTEEIASAVEVSSVTRDQHQHRRAYLKIAPVTLSSCGATINTYALLDEGSTVTIIDEALADALGIKGPAETMWVQGISGTSVKHEKSRLIDVQVRGQHEKATYTIRNARTVQQLKFTTQTILHEDIQSCEHLKGLEDDLIYDEACPRMLIGQDNWELIVSREVRAGRRDQPAASLTLLGWVLHGCATTAKRNTIAFCGHLQTHENEENIEKMMKNYFELDSIGILARKNKEDPEDQAISILEKNTRKLQEGRYETSLIWKNEDAKIPNNYKYALRRLENLEKKLDKDPSLKRQYEERIANLFASGYAEPATSPAPQDRTWYLPHFAVVNPDKDKIRVVHDAAAKTAGVSLNDMLLSGPDLLQSLPGIVLRFRQHPHAVSADIREMFMQVKIRQQDRDALRFLWRGQERDSKPAEYRMTSLIFGATSSPCTALFVKNKNALEHIEKYPEAAQAIMRDHYMDDYIASFRSEEEALRTSLRVDQIHRQAGFELRGWVSNTPAVLEHLPGTAGQKTVPIGGSTQERTLGLLWNVEEDSLGFRLNLRRTPQEVTEGHRPPTKREALSIIMSLFDPLGLVSPLTTPAKRIMQDTWAHGTGWDEVLPEELHHRWESWLQRMKMIDALRVPRPYSTLIAVIRRDLHTFVDASEEAYAAAVYLRIEHQDGSIKIVLVMAKSKVTPLKPVSIPRLELQAALIGARLANNVITELTMPIETTTYWSDSRTALSWIRAEPRTFKTFVAHRLAEIEELTKKKEWRWVPTAENVADDATRSTPTDFDPHHRWFNGPKFLYGPTEQWPEEIKTTLSEDDAERRMKREAGPTISHAYYGSEGGEHAHCTDNSAHLPEITRFSSWEKLIRATGRVLQFIDLCKRHKNIIAATRHKRTLKNTEKDTTWNNKKEKTKTVCKPSRKENENKDKYLVLKPNYLLEAESLWLRKVQEDDLAEERRRAWKGLCPSKEGKLTNVAVIIGQDGLLRVKGRTEVATGIAPTTINPIIVDGRHQYVKMYIMHVHKKLHHAGVEAVVNELRQRVWVIRVRPAVKTAIKGCGACILRKARPTSPATGDLPAARLAHHARPFTFTGLDYFGPVEVTVGRRVEKRYVGLFTCMTSRAIHLELVTSLTADAAINAVRRFIARRGAPKEIWSDNATTFKAANRELRGAADQAVEKEVTARNIVWRFIPPASPFMGGAWERMVRTVKTSLAATLTEKKPKEDTLLTVLAEVELTVNSRPLTHVTTTPGEPEAITPNHILLGPSCHAPSPGDFGPADVTARAQWRRAQAIADEFWRRWVREYLPTLHHRREPHTRGSPPKIGDLVLIGDPNHPRNVWPRGRVTRVFPGRDGEVRVVDVQTAGGHILRRPTKRIVVLPFMDREATAGEMCTTE